jgi:hypothetical protein
MPTGKLKKGDAVMLGGFFCKVLEPYVNITKDSYFGIRLFRVKVEFCLCKQELFVSKKEIIKIPTAIADKYTSLQDVFENDHRAFFELLALFNPKLQKLACNQFRFSLIKTTTAYFEHDDTDFRIARI